MLSYTLIILNLGAVLSAKVIQTTLLGFVKALCDTNSIYIIIIIIVSYAYQLNAMRNYSLSG
jgi:hypothetical protein